MLNCFIVPSRLVGHCPVSGDPIIYIRHCCCPSWIPPDCDDCDGVGLSQWGRGAVGGVVGGAARDGISPPGREKGGGAGDTFTFYGLH